MVPSGATAGELWISVRGAPGLGVSRLFRSKVRSSVAARGPGLGERPVCCASIWYIGRPWGARGGLTAAATLADGLGAAPGLAGTPPMAGLGAEAGVAAGLVGWGLGVTTTVWAGLWQATRHAKLAM